MHSLYSESGTLTVSYEPVGRDDWVESQIVDHQENRGPDHSVIHLAGLPRPPSPISFPTSTTTSSYCLKVMLDRRTTLCLACSSSLPPNVDDSELFTTKCCERPICPRCLETNPRLARYNPCLVCLAGVGVIQASSSSRNRPVGKPAGGAGAQSVKVENLDGGVKDQDLFVLADDDDDEEDSDLEDDMSFDGEDSGRCSRSAAPPPPDVIQTNFPLPKTPPPPPVTVVNTAEYPITNATRMPPPPSDGQQPTKPVLYRLRRGDTLVGIALRFRLDAMELCRLNDLPTTTLSTTPHVLHTRTTILLPPTSKPPPEEDPAPAEARRVERAEKRFQMVTKEVDWRVAKAYVALAQDPDTSVKEKPENWEGGSSQKGILEGGAIDRYLEDTEWEEQERKDGRDPVIQKFPWGPLGPKLEQGSGTQQGSSGFKWPWSV